MSDKTTIWTLNKAYDLIAGPQTFPVKKTAEEVQQELCEQFDHKIRFGQREDSGNQLMPDTEYFVPIAPKCIGSYFDSAEGETRQRLADIQDYYCREAGQSNYKVFWDQMTDDYQMQTEKYKGYYSIIEQQPSNILIGYSQGGLVTRYLNWLDKVVFKKNLIKGVITISSPNFGSPLANQENAASIFKGLWDIVLVLLGKDTVRLQSSPVTPVTQDSLRNFIKDLHIEINSKMHLSAVAPNILAKKAQLSDFLIELYNWLSGLRNDPNNAFYDLNLMRMEPNYSKAAAEYSVLASISQAVPEADRIKGLISANWHSRDFLYDAAVMTLVGLLKKCLNKNQKTNRALMNAGVTLESANLTLTRDKFDRIDKIYSRQIMQEHHRKEISNPLVKQIMDRHEQGTASPVTLDPYAHDFIIPSAYQLTLDNEHQISEANHVNNQADHLSGSSLNFTAGRENREKVIDYLHALIG